MKKNRVIISKFLTDDSVSIFFSDCYRYLDNQVQSYWNKLLKKDYDGVKDIVAEIINETQKTNNLKELGDKVDTKVAEAKKTYDNWCLEEKKYRRDSYSLLDPTLFGLHNTAIIERDNTYESLMLWKLFRAYIDTVLERREEDKSIINDLGLETATEVIDTEYIRNLVKKIKTVSISDSSEAIGKSKELLEATFKFVLEKNNIEFTAKDNLNSLSKKVRKTLGFEEIDKGNGTQTVVTGLNSIVSGLAEMRNMYGAGHGKEPSFVVLPVSYGRLAVSAASTYIEFILHEFEYKKEHDGGK